MQVVLALLAKKGSLKKAEVVETCKSIKVDMSDTQMSKQLKELCMSRGGSWSLRES